ncbi:MAG: sigma-54-dependent transcriptional regulator [Granulosicoccus sp.]
MSRKLALVIEDDQTLSRAYQRVLVDLGYRVEISNNIADARLMIRDMAPVLILVDIELPDGNGLDLMDELRNSTRERFIVISGNSTQRAAIKSIRHRAVKFVTKPVSLSELKLLVGEAITNDSDVVDLSGITTQTTATDTPEYEDSWINHGNSPALVELRTAISFSAELRKGHALIVGEPGLEKRSIAIELHKRSRRSGKIVFMDCANQTDKNLQREMFGLNSNQDRSAMDQGCIGTAAGGTLVLDNVDKLSDEMQSVLSLFLDTGIFKQPDSEQGYKAIVAVLGIVSDQGKPDCLRTDFVARLSKVTLNVPSLRECASDIPAISNWLLATIKHKETDYFMPGSMLSQMREARWPGNISELRNAIQGAVDHATIAGSSENKLHLPKKLQQHRWEPLTEMVGLTLRDFGKQLIVATLAHHQGDKAKTAQTLGISLKTLYNRLNTH